MVLQGVPPEATEAQLRACVERFGRPKHLSFAVDKLSGRRTGVAFVEFPSRDTAAAVVSAAAEKPLVLAGCRVKARSLDSAPPDPSAANAKVDKRNLYLAREGEVPLGSPAAIGVSAEDMQKRQQAAAEKAEKLRNPNYHVSATRLFFRNLPPSLDEKRLAKLCADAVEARTGQAPDIRGVHVMRDASRLDKAGKPKSKGSAYVELGNHPDALATLRAVNNNPTVFTKDRRPIVEFALEDKRQSYKRDVKLAARRRAGRDGDGARGGGGEGGGDGGPPPERGGGRGGGKRGAGAGAEERRGKKAKGGRDDGGADDDGRGGKKERAEGGGRRSGAAAAAGKAKGKKLGSRK